MNYSNESMDRIEKIKKLKNAGVIPYADKFEKKYDIQEIINLKEQYTKDSNNLMQDWANRDFKTAGRLVSFHSHGKLAFGKIKDHSSTIQVCFVKNSVKFNTWEQELEELEIENETKNAYKIMEKLVDIGDFIGIEWDLFYTKHWELTLFVDVFQVLSKAIRPLPEKWHGLKDEELIYRQRYLDLIANEESYQRMIFRSNFMKTLRKFYEEKWFLEVETPILGNAASWAAAKPFVTYHEDFEQDFYLRISPETALKKATVGRFEKIFEVARNFRNEWSDPSHMQEFTMVEHYAAWWNFEDNMKFTEEMFDYLFKNLEMHKKINIKDKEWNVKEVDWTTPWERVDYIQWVKEACWIDVSNYQEWEEEKLLEDIKKAWVEFEWMNQMWLASLIDNLYKKVLRPNIVWPAFVYNYPKTMQPLSRTSDKNSNIVEQFQLVVNWWEIVKAYSELVDPIQQKENFDAQAEALARWDEEATSSDDEFLLAMEYWMPPQSGLGMWIDRVLALLTEQDNMRDVVLFPLMKKEDDTN